MDILDQISREAQKAGEFLAEKAVAAKNYTVATWNAAELRNRIERCYKAIGKAVYDAHQDGIDKGAEIDSYMEEITALKQALKEKEGVRQEAFNRKLCPSCDKAICKDDTFCPHCGVQVK